MECYICSLFPSVRKINVSTLTSEGALGIDNGRYEAFHLKVTSSALPHVGRHHQYLPSAPPQPSAQCEMDWSQFWALGTDVWVPAGSLGCFSRKWDGPGSAQPQMWWQPQPSARTEHHRGTWPSAVLVRPMNSKPVIPALCRIAHSKSRASLNINLSVIKLAAVFPGCLQLLLNFIRNTSIIQHKEGASAASRLWKSPLKWRSILHLTK